MSAPHFLCLCLISRFLFVSSLSADNSLRFVQIVWRHGQRTPYEVMSAFADPGNQEESWPDGLGELTEFGKLRSYELGQVLQDRYGQFLNKTFKADKIRCHSGEQNRTIATADLALEGLFASNKSSTLHAYPVHTRKLIELTEGNDLVKSWCPNFAYVANNDAYKELNRKYASLLHFLSEKTGRNLTHVLFYLTDIRDILLCEKENDHSWPNWVNKTLFEEIQLCYYEAIFVLFGVPEIVQMSGGWLLRQMLEEFETFLTSNTSRKFFGYSGHDMNVNFFARALRINLTSWPQYNAFISVELHERQREYFLDIWYQGGIGKNLTRLDIKGCPYPCLYSTFAANSQSYLSPKDWPKACGLIDSENDKKEIAIIAVLGTLAAIFFASSLVLGICCCNQRRKYLSRGERLPLLNRTLA